MRSLGLTLLACSFVLAAQAPDDPEIARARIDLNRVRALVESGVLPRAQLQKAEDAIADATDAVAIRKSIYSQDLTEDQANELVAAANRRFERRKKAFDDAKKLVDVGAAPAQSLDNLLLDMDFARKDCELADNRADLAQQIAAMAEAEAAAQAKMPLEPAELSKTAERYDGDGLFTPEMFSRIQTAFEQRFGKPLPVSANGETAVHRALGFDHRGRVDVALRPDQAEGVWLREYLKARRIPYFAFSHAVPGKATGAHIHLGPASTRLAPADAGG
jgi:multidrug resistance efflux pump